MNLFLEAFKKLPLILCDDTEIETISYIRITGLAILLMIIVSPYLAYYHGGIELFIVIMPYWEKLLLFFGTTYIANIAKKYINKKGECTDKPEEL